MIDASDIFRALQRRARERRLNTQQQLELYVHERLLARIADSEFADRIVLKGGMLLAALDVRDVTRDADLAARAIDNDPDQIRSIITDVVAVDFGDGVEFDVASISVDTMREDAEYHGLRVRIPAQLHAARLVAQLDVSFGDPISGQARRIPALLGSDFEMLTYSVEAVLAEKIVTMISRGDANTRDRDFGDVWLVAQRFDIDFDELRADIVRTAAHRGNELRPLAEVLLEIRELREASWQRYRTRTALSALPNGFSAVVDFCILFADPVILGTQLGSRWSADAQRWSG